jgi:hypothetical protein
MIIWSAFKQVVDSNPSELVFYTTEAHLRSVAHPSLDVDRYFIYLELNGKQIETAIILEDPVNADQTDFDNNYKDGCILT